MEDTNKLYDELAQECGEKVTETEYKVVDADTLVSDVIEEKPQFAYADSDKPIPGTNYVLESDNMTKNQAIEDMIMKNAIMKAQKEQSDATKKKQYTKEEIEQKRKEYVDYMVYQQGEAYYLQNHYIMDARTKRRTRKYFEKMWEKKKNSLLNAVNLNE